MIFGMRNPEKIWHKSLTHCPPRLSDVAAVPWEIEKVIFNSIVHTYFWLFTLSHKKTICNPLAHPPKNVITLTCELQNFFIWLKVCCVLSDVGGFEKTQLWVVIGGSEKNLLWCVAAVMSGKQCHSKCSEWPPSALIHASSLFRQCTVTQYTMPCWNSAHIATSRCRKPQHVHINTCTSPVVCPRRSTGAMQVIGSTKQ